MDPARAARLSAWLADDLVRAAGGEGAAIVRRALERAASTADFVEVLRHGTTVCFAPGSNRRLFEFDRAGTLLAALAWSPAGALASAWLRIPNRTWLGIEPRAEAGPGEPVDRLWHAERPGAAPFREFATPLTVFAALDYAAIDAIPPLAAPARLPPGGGTAVLNLLASLAADQGRRALAYGGPYPTEQLFLALLEAFRYETGGADPLAAFTTGELAWAPDPHERHFSPHGPYVQLRGRVEKVVARGITYLRPDWQGVARRAPRRVRDVAGGVACSLVLLDTVVDDRLLLSADGEVLRVVPAAPAGAAPRPIARPLWRGIAAAVAATSAAALAPFLRAAAEAITPEWGPVADDLLAFDESRATLSDRARDLIRRRVDAAPGRAERLEIALTAVSELAELVGDGLRARAQRRLEALPPSAQETALHAGGSPDAPPGATVAREIADALEALLADLAVTSSPERSSRR